VPAASWAVKLFERHRDDDPSGSCPAEAFLMNDCPDGVCIDLQAIVDAVAASPPPQFTGGGMWEAMHGDMAGFYEARTRGPNKMLYRLFCVLEQDGAGLGGPTIVIIDGMAKKIGTTFTKAEYARVKALRDEYYSREPRNAF
jgi:hypothetical protein